MKGAPVSSAPAKAERRTSLKQGALLNWISLATNFSVSFLLTPVIIQKLGNAGFGMWSLIQSFAGYYGLVNLGLASALQRFISRDLAKHDEPSLQATVGTAIAFFVVTGVAVLGASLLLGAPIARFFQISDAADDAFATTVRFCAVAVVVDFFGALLTTMFTAKERFDLSNLLNIGRQLLQAAGIVVTLTLAPSLHGIALVVASTSLLALVVSWNLAVRQYPSISIGWKGAELSRLKELLHYGMSTMLITISNIIRLRLGNVVIGRTSGMAAVSTFSIAANLLVSMNGIMASTMNVLNPRFTRLHTQENRTELHRLYRIALFGSSTIACAMGLLVLVLGEKFILLWVGPNFLPSVPILQVLTVAYVFALAQSPSWNLMFALGRHHFMARITIAEAVGIVVVGIWLSHIYGAIGFAWATAGAMLITKILLHAPYAAKIADMRLGTYLAPLMPPLIVASGLLAVSWAVGLPALINHSGVATFLLAAAGLGSTYIGLLLVLVRRRDFVPESLWKKSPRFMHRFVGTKMQSPSAS